jgi:hypothetical protein
MADTIFRNLPVGHSYAGRTEPLDGAVDPWQMANAIQTLCRNATSDAGWPAQIQLWRQPSIRNLPFELGRARKQLAKAISEAFNFLSQPPQSARAILRQIATPAQATPQISGAAAAPQPLAKPPARSAKPPRK